MRSLYGTKVKYHTPAQESLSEREAVKHSVTGGTLRDLFTMP